MINRKLKILCFIAISLMFLCTPFLLDISPDGKAYAMGFLGSSGGGGRSSSSGRVTASSPATSPESSPGLNGTEPGSGSNPTTSVPEPATLLLFGAGAVGMAVFRKKLGKKK